ncbi:hypothetical protein L1987_02761 [Smallanthus sonchifolius]|uniref:Uncharacterized protein n=1 Tax=Smallanthus sonchifolius TaxID=185202 RepID=A0ACB9K8W0_9ASTR|nr:hypothetical protein L1987_02761 [Smallanthus sonchifolius]
MNLRPLRKKRDQVDNIKPESEGISNPCEDRDSEEKLIMVYEEIDHHEALNVSVKKHDVYLTLEEHVDNLMCEKVLSG